MIRNNRTATEPYNLVMPLSRHLKRSILQNPFGFYVRMQFRIDEDAYHRLLADVRQLVDETRDDTEIDKEVLLAIWSDIRVVEGMMGSLERAGKPIEEIVEIQNHAIELDAALIDLLAVNPSSEDWGWWKAHGSEPPTDWPSPLNDADA